MPDFDVIIPARDEEPTVAGVVRAARGAAGVGRVIVVDDGSSDGTAGEASRAGATVIRARPAGEPGSKAQALARGVEASDAPVLVFFDADIVDVQPVHFEALAAPVLSGGVALSCGIVDYGALRNPFFLRLPPITGLRAIPRDIFEAVPESRRNGFQIEIMINEVVVRRGLPSAIRVLAGLLHRSKIEKRGWRQGVPSHLAMTRELLACLRIVPLWTYGAYLRNLRILPPAVAGGPRPAALREAESSVPGTSP
jgi:glycosyltransferase involved in cell wall biosynthesis